LLSEGKQADRTGCGYQRLNRLRYIMCGLKKWTQRRPGETERSQGNRAVFQPYGATEQPDQPVKIDPRV
ncbi:MAG TPA: hypothetical protein DEB39_07300, partial [Planctomycetaceae bacterium]|nr:hypothetical protein [Planctomycetaceae bacterium]